MKPAAKKSKAAASLRKAAEARLKKQSAGRLPSSEADVRRLQHELEVHQIELEMQNDELRRAQAEIAAGLEQYTELYDFAPNGYFSLNAAGIIQLVNLTGAAMVGVARGRLLGKVFERLLTASDQKVFRDFFKRALVAETAVHCEVSLTRAGQSLRFFRLEAKRAPSVGNCLVALMDISERVKNEVVLRESEARFRAYIEQAADAVFVHDFSGRFIEVNQQACASLGYTREELLHMTVMDVETDFNLAQARVFWDGLAEGKTKTLLGHQRRKDGSVFPVEVKFGFYELHGERHLVGLARDITERVKTAAVLQESEAKFAQTFHASPVAMALSSIENGRLLDVNGEFARLTGWSRDEAVGRTTTELGIWTNAADRNALMAEIKAHGVVRNHQLQLHSKSGRTADLLWSAQRVTVGGKELLLSAALDVTVQKQMETALVDTQENLITLVNSLPDNVIFKDGAGRWLVANPPAVDFFQLKGFSWVGKTDAELAEERPALKDLFAACIRSDEAGWAAGGLTCVTERGPGPDGLMQEHEVHKVPLFNADGSRHALLVIGRDITERRQTEVALQLKNEQIQRLNSLLQAMQEIDDLLNSEKAASELPAAICNSLVKTRNYVAVWLGNLDTASKTVVMVAHAGSGGFFSKTTPITWDDTPLGQGPTGIAIRERRAVVFEDISIDPRFAPWRDAAAACGVVSVACIPIIYEKQLFGVINVKANHTNVFDRDEVELLTRLASNIGRVRHNKEVQKEKERLEDALRLSELMASQSRDALLLVRNRDGRIVSANAAAVEFYGYNREELLAKTIYDLRQNNDVALAAHQLSQAFASGILFETVHVHKDGHTIPVEVSSHGTDFAGEGFLVSSIRDITARKKAESNLLQLEQSMAAAANGIFLVKPNGKIFWVNAAFTRMTGYSAEEALGKNPRFLKSGQHDTGFYRELWQTVLAGKVWKAEIFNRRKDGTIYPENKTITPVIGADGQLSHFICVQEDITARKQIEMESARLAAIVTSSEDAIVGKLLDGTITTWNQGAEKIFGFTAAEMVGTSIHSIIPADLQSDENQILATIARGESVKHFETIRQTKDGRLIDVSIATSPIRDATGKILGASKVARDITQRKQAERDLAKSHSLLHATLESTADGILVVDTNGKSSGFNQKFLELWQIPSKLANTKDDRQMLEHVLSQLTEPEKFLARVTELYANPTVTSFEELEFKDGRMLERYSQPQQIGDAVVGRVWSFRDITARKRAENNLRINENRLRTWFEMPLAGLAITSPEKGWIQVNDRLCEMLGFTRQELYGMTWEQLTHPADLPENKANFERVVSGEINGYAMEKRFLRKNGEYLAVDLTVRCTRLADGKIDYIVALIQDITARKQAEAEIIKARDFHLQLLQNAPTLIWRAGTDAKCDWFNQTWLNFTGRTMEQEFGDGWAAGVHPDDLDNCVKRYLAHFEKRESFMLEYRLRRHDGEYRWISDHGQPFNLPSGGFGGYIGYCYDIHEIKSAQELLEKRVAERTREIAMLSEVVDQATVGFSMSNPDGSFITVNESYARLTGYTRDEILVNKLNWNKELTPPEWRPISAEKLEECLRTRQAVRFEKEYLRKDGSRVPVEVFVQPTYDSDGKLLHLRAFITDISERNKNAKALELAWKLANEASRAKSEFLANMSHEIRTPLNAILGFTQLLRQDSNLPDSVHDKLKIIGKSGDNLLGILNDILDLAKIEAGRMAVQLVEFPCAGMLAEIVQLFRPPAEAKQLSLSLEKVGEIPHLVRADGEKIRRVLTNLLGNAVKFTQAGGIEVTATTISGGEGQPLRLHVAVKDTGPGLTPEEINRLFKKFEQASAGRASQVGTGLGLAISQQYAQMLGGHITVQSQVGQGSTFVFEVPIEPVFDTDHIQRKTPRSTLRLAPAQPECRVLVVDDLEDNRTFLLEILKLSGFACRPAASGAEALAVTAEWQPQLVLMDTRMPEMDGLETIRQLRAGLASSGLKIISLTATAYAEDREASLKAGADEFVAKPVQIPELLEKIRQLLKLSYVSLTPELTDTVAAPIPTRADTVAVLARQPESWRNQLRDELLQADFNAVEKSIKKIQPQYPALAISLSKLAGRFDAESILQLLVDAAVIASNHRD